MSSIVLFDDKKDCCGCGACMNVCPKNAIRMAEDEVGFVYPEIDQNLCVGCGACKKACGYQTQPLMQKSEAVYAAASNNDNFLRKSASGGAFAVLAENVLKKDGVVYGAALPLENGKLEPKHLRIDTVERLPELQGSKYVQSAIGDTYAQAQKDLLDGKRVLFSGTPCQIAGLKQYLKKDYKKTRNRILTAVCAIACVAVVVSFVVPTVAQQFSNIIKSGNRLQIIHLKIHCMIF